MVSRTDRGAHGAAGDAGTYGRFPVRVALGELGADIKANGLGVPIEFWQDGKDRFLIDGRNRLEAMERVGIEDYPATETCNGGSPLARIISLNIRRRHLTKEQQAELIVAAVKADAEPRQDGEVSDMDGEIPDDMLRIYTPCGLPTRALIPKEFVERELAKAERKGGRGQVDQVKAKAVELAKENGIGKRTVERAMRRPKGRRRFRPGRRAYLALYAKLDFDAARLEALKMEDELRVLLNKAEKASQDEAV